MRPSEGFVLGKLQQEIGGRGEQEARLSVSLTLFLLGSLGLSAVCHWGAAPLQTAFSIAGPLILSTVRGHFVVLISILSQVSTSVNRMQKNYQKDGIKFKINT